MKQHASLLLLITILAGLLAACGQQTAPTGGSAATSEATSATGGAATTAATSAATTEATTAGTTEAMTATTSAATTAATTEATTAATSAATTAATSGAAAGGTSGTIRIYSSLPRQGASKGQTDAVVNAIKLRLGEDKNQVCNGQFTIDYQDLDDATAAAGKWDAATETSNANKAVSDPDAMVYIGTFNSGAAALSIPILNQANLVMISPANTAIGLTKKSPDPGSPDKYYPTLKNTPPGKRNYTRVVPADNLQGAADAAWAQKLGAKSIYILDDQEVYGKGIADVVESESMKLKLQVLGHEGIDPKAQDYRALMTKISTSNNGNPPDVVFFGGIVDNNAGQLLKDLRSVGMTPDKVKFIGPDGIQTDSFITGAGADVAEGAYATIAGLPTDQLGQKGKDYTKNYTAKYGNPPESYGIYGYEAANVALAAINKVCKKDRAAIRDAVFATKDFDGVLGKWSFDADGDTTLASYQGFIVKDGKWVINNTYVDGKWTK